MIIIKKVKLTQRSKGSPLKGSQSSAGTLSSDKFKFIITNIYNQCPGRVATAMIKILKQASRF